MCADCGKEVSIHAESCPHCGAAFVKRKHHGVFFYVFCGTLSLIATGLILCFGLAFLTGIIGGVHQVVGVSNEGVSPGARKEVPLTAAEQRLIDVFPQLLWKKRDLIANGWAKPGQDLSKKSCYFEKKKYSFNGIVGEMQFNTEGEKQICVAFFIDGDNNDFLKLHQVFERACDLPTVEREVLDKNDNDIKWIVLGATNKYCIHLVQRQFGRDVERSVEAYVVGLNAPCPFK